MDYAGAETLLQNGAQPRRVTLSGREYLVAPVAMLIDGVLAGSDGPGYYPPSETRRVVDRWNGVPITVNHPYDPKTGQSLSAEDDGVMPRQGIGTVLNTLWDGKLRAEGWFDVAETRAKAPTVYADLIAGRPIELSTGLHTYKDRTRGTHNGKPYDWVARDHKPDHLAVLVGQVGACSREDGCGVNVTNTEPTDEQVDTWWNKVKRFLFLEGVTLNTPKHPVNGKFHPEGLMPAAHAEKGFGMKLPDPAVEAAAEDGYDDIEADDADIEAEEDIENTGGDCACGGTCDDCKKKKSTTNADDDVQWITMGGVHIPIKGGKFAAGPLKGRDVKDTKGNGQFLAKKEERDAARKDKSAGAKAERRSDKSKVKEAMAKGYKPTSRDKFIQARQAEEYLAKHSTKNSKGEEMTRTQVIEYLTTNCECWRGCDKTLNTLTDAQLVALKRNAEKMTALEVTGNSLLAIAKEHGAPADLTVNAMPDFIKKKIEAKKKKEGGDEEEVENADPEEDEDDEEEEDEKTMNTKRKKVTNDAPKPITERLTPEERQVWNMAVEITNGHKDQLVKQLVANVRDEKERARLTEKFRAMDVPDLRDVLALRGPTANTGQVQQLPLAIFTGAQGGPVDNAAPTDNAADDILDIPDMDFSDSPAAGARQIA